MVKLRNRMASSKILPTTHAAIKKPSKPTKKKKMTTMGQERTEVTADDEIMSLISKAVFTELFTGLKHTSDIWK